MESAAKAIAVRLAQAVMDYDAQGRLVQVSIPRAQAALRRAFEMKLRSGGRPQVLQLAAAQAASFPRVSTLPAAGAAPWLAQGADAAELSTSCLRWVEVQHVDPEPRRACVEMAMLTVLARVCSKAGFPVTGNA
jgi:hypothetical protein